jgi:hypothetical protein
MLSGPDIEFLDEPLPLESLRTIAFSLDVTLAN